MRGNSDTNTHTYFFRESAALRVARAHLAEVGARKKRVARAWCAGCSSGAEPYSLAILLAEAGDEAEIHATDINPQALAQARAGRYSRRDVRRVEPARLERWFVGGESDVSVVDDVRRRVRFDLHDVACGTAPVGGAWDVILCRNVLVHLDLEGVGRAVSTFIDGLAPGGLLLLGASEWLSSKLQRNAPRLADPAFVCQEGVVGYQRMQRDARAVGAAHGRDGSGGSPSFVVPRAAAVGGGRAMRIAAMPNDATAAAISSGLPPGVEQLRLRGDQQLDAGNLEAALSHFEEALGVDDLLADLHLRRGLTLLRLGKASDAVDALRRSLFLEPAFWPAAMLLGDLVTEQDTEAAARYYRQAQATLASRRAGGGVLTGALAAFAAGRGAALEAVEARLVDVERATFAATVRRFAHT